MTNQSQLCPKFEKAMSILSKRWTGLVVYQLLRGSQRFCEIEASIGISGRLLSDRLKHLENEGMVKRDVYPETPIRIEYSLTEKGRALEPLMNELEQWSKTWIDEKEAVQR
ncbi:transcriptional regulator, HxlR family [Alteribacillus persepolensis]|uniref:Transcriptional regulator, HxlR family n=1 Tax=Alteribacillus persepolensis TaxID=568899 RepID=A0A1G8H204_9BACI|nr:helix-turn-helix domain-containing protein [Alteribacillus persepolensis]SDI00667.1 transcriptional regulator, HxlR family [Alteribacillus persepolensis]